MDHADGERTDQSESEHAVGVLAHGALAGQSPECGEDGCGCNSSHKAGVAEECTRSGQNWNDGAVLKMSGHLCSQVRARFVVEE